jgi:hypothetical protein
MIYGLNFNNTHFPPSVAGLFSPDRQFFKKWYTLQGLCNTEFEVEQMCLLADNGHRNIQWVGPRTRYSQRWFAVYIR